MKLKWLKSHCGRSSVRNLSNMYNVLGSNFDIATVHSKKNIDMLVSCNDLKS